MDKLGNIAFDCAQTPLWFPPDISLNSLTVTTTSGINISAPSPGSLQILSRRHGKGKALGDGVNIVESSGITATFRGQRYFYGTTGEAIMHFPGLHKFPGRTSPYQGEYHIHLSTGMEPQRDLTLVIPMLLASGDISGHPYFNACTATGNAVNRPTLASLIPYGSDVIQYQGPDIRHRTKDNPKNNSCNELVYDYQFLLVLTPVYIAAASASSINSCGNVYTDPRDLPKTCIAPIQSSLDRKLILKQVVLARPGIIDPNPKPVTCAPIPTPTNPEPEASSEDSDNSGSNGGNLLRYIEGILCAFGIIIGVIILDFMSGFLWSHLFKGDAVKAWVPMKALIIAVAVITSIFTYRDFVNYMKFS